jgi:hypothetical protein
MDMTKEEVSRVHREDDRVIGFDATTEFLFSDLNRYLANVMA